MFDVSKVKPGDLVMLIGRTIKPQPRKIQLVVRVEKHYFDKYFSMHKAKDSVYSYVFSDGTKGISYAYRKINIETMKLEGEVNERKNKISANKVCK